MGLALGYPCEGRDVSGEIQERVHLDGALGPTEARPREEREAEVDCGRVECVDGASQLGGERFVGVEPSRIRDQRLAKSA